MSGATACTYAQPQRIDAMHGGPDSCAVIVAGGSGERFGDPRGKQFVELAGLPLVAWSILAFNSAPSIAYVVLVCPVGRERQMHDDVLGRLDLRCEVTLAAGGRTRQDSVFSGLMEVPQELDLVAIHDGARPLIEVETIEDCLAAVRDNRNVNGALCASRVTDTLKMVDGSGRVVGTPDRSQLWSAQTPQAFKREVILSAHETALLEGFVGTDDASIVEHVLGNVCVVEAPRDNIKVTVPEDLAIAEAILQARAGIR